MAVLPRRLFVTVRALDISVYARIYGRICTYCQARRRPDAFRHRTAVPGVQLSGAAPGGPPRHPVLRPVPGTRWVADDTAVDPGEVETLGSAYDQRARARTRHGSHNAWKNHAAAGA